MRTVAKFEISKKGMADLERQVRAQLRPIEVEANRAAERESTAEGKAQAFARVLRAHGVADVDEAELRKKFGGD